jgi:hypothetical protein
MEDTKQIGPGTLAPAACIPAPLAPILLMTFWMLLGGAAGIKLGQSLWQLVGWGAGDVSIAVPVGGVGAVAGALLGLISNPRLLVLLMAMFAGPAAGAVAGKLPWGEIGEVGGQVAGGWSGPSPGRSGCSSAAGRVARFERQRMRPPARRPRRKTNAGLDQGDRPCPSTATSS